MNVTSILFEAYLKCPTKCFLKSWGETDGRNAYANWIQTESENYRNEGRERLMDTLPSGECVPSLADMGNLKNAKWRLAVDLAAHTQNLASKYSRGRTCPVRGARQAHLVHPGSIRLHQQTHSRRQTACWRSMRSYCRRSVGRNVPFGKIIYGDHHATLKVKTLALAGKVRKLTGKIAALLSSHRLPTWF